MYLDQNLKFLREQMGIRQDEMAKKLHVTPSAVGNWEKGRREPELKMIIKIADLFKVSLDDLIMHNLKPHVPLFVRNIRFLQKEYGVTDKELALIMGANEKKVKMWLKVGLEGFFDCPDCRSRIAEYFGLPAVEINLKDLSKAAEQEVSG